RALAATLAMALLLWLLKDLLAAQFAGGELARILALAGLVIAGMLAYALAAGIFRAVQWDEIKALLARRR
ncbi:MAG: murein biosynthesis integral membrane protein MurJ, partial [Alphaproteobacteria bacterium]|nr:murein biosynthesis integral membrane protein MurJ [Alphaproteobacteria bacterium]